MENVFITCYVNLGKTLTSLESIVSSLKWECKYLNCSCNFARIKITHIYIFNMYKNYVSYINQWSIINKCSEIIGVIIFICGDIFLQYLSNDQVQFQPKALQYCMRRTVDLVKLNKGLWIQFQIYLSRWMHSPSIYQWFHLSPLLGNTCINNQMKNIFIEPTI